MSIFSKLNFKDQAFQLRENAILDATTQILATKGFDLMTVDDVVNLAGLSKPILYKHFKSKDDLVAKLMTRLIEAALEKLDAMPETTEPKEKLGQLLEWALRMRLNGGLPFLPSTSAAVRDMLTKNLTYVTKVMKLNSKLEAIVKQGQSRGQLKTHLTSDVILFSYYARSCDPAVDYLKRFSKMGDDAIVEGMLKVCFEGI
jgi:TetR/AcrR family transcriptional regulator of autoinduction and epiphytic fitness